MRAGRAGDANGGLERGVLVLRIQVGDDGDIVHVQRRKGHQVVLAVDAAQTPEIALVQAAGGGLLVNAERHQVALAGLEGFGHVDVECREAAFVVTGALAVDEDLGAVVNAVEMPEHALPGEGGRNLNPAAVQANIIAIGSYPFLVSGDGESLRPPSWRGRGYPSSPRRRRRAWRNRGWRRRAAARPLRRG